MKLNKTLLVAIVALFALTMQACKAKKVIVATPAPPPAAIAKPEPAPQPTPPAAAPAPEPAPAPEKPDYNFKNIQFEFNSAVLKTASYPILDKVAVELKKDPSARFMISGHSSAEGTAEHNMSLSLDRANSVKQYLDNAGAFGDNIQVKGYGESVPLTENKTEEGRALNRRVEIKLLP
jgi:OOP family OmpA-OmpF porin